jgi:S1-C subfamily serine protease
LNNSISAGIVSGLGRDITAGDAADDTTEQLDKLIQTDAAINPGNSGGPLLTLDGTVIGINVATAQGSQSIGFALPINSVKSFIAQND